MQKPLITQNTQSALIAGTNLRVSRAGVDVTYHFIHYEALQQQEEKKKRSRIRLWNID